MVGETPPLLQIADEGADLVLADPGDLRAVSCLDEEVPEIAHAVGDDGDGAGALTFGGGVQLKSRKKSSQIAVKICRSKRCNFTKLIFWGKIGTKMGG